MTMIKKTPSKKAATNKAKVAVKAMRLKTGMRAGGGDIVDGQEP
jgi:hypothetical protein